VGRIVVGRSPRRGMHLTPRERTNSVSSCRELARKRKTRGVKCLNYPKPLRADSFRLLEESHEWENSGRMDELGTNILLGMNVMEGVPEMSSEIHRGDIPRWDDACHRHQTDTWKHIPENTASRAEPSRQPGRATNRAPVRNRGDRPIQVGSHAILFEVKSRSSISPARALRNAN